MSVPVLPRGAYLFMAAGMMLAASEAARAQDAGTPPPAAQTPPTALDPSDPLAPLPDLGVAWPDLEDRSDELIDGQPPTETASAGPAERRYSVRIDGIEEVRSDLLRSRFDELSVLKQNDGDPANGAQIDRRAREDAELLVELLRAEGYYDARVRPDVEPEGERLIVTLRVRLGEIYQLADVDLAGVERAGDRTDELVEAFGIDQQDPANADKIVAGEEALRAEVGRQGFPFAKVGEPELVVDHENRTARLNVAVDPGTQRRYGTIRMANDEVFDGDHVMDIARFDSGELYNSDDVTDLGRALIATGLVSSADVKPVPGATPETVDIAVDLDPAPPRTIAGELGYGTGEGFRAEVSWTHRNLFKPEGALTLRGVAGTEEQLASVSFRRNNFHARDRVLTAQISAANINRNAFDAKTLSLSGGLELQSNLIFQKPWTWSIGGELLASDERDTIVTTGEERRRTFFIAALPGSLYYDGTDDLLNPTRGFRLGGRLSPELSLQDNVFGYARTQVDGSVYLPFGERVVLAARTRLGTIAGASRDSIAPSRRFYAGGGGSVRGYAYQAIGPRDADNNPIGGKSLAEFSLEARVRFGNFGVVPFVDAGNISEGSLPGFDNLRIGAGIGARYYSNFGPIRIDVGTPINPAPGDPRIAVYVSLGQAF